MRLLRAVAVVLAVLVAFGAGADEGVRVDDSPAPLADHHSSRTHLDTSHQREEDPAGATPSTHGSHASKPDHMEDGGDESTSDDDYWASDDYDCEDYSDYDYYDPYDYNDYAYDDLPDQYDEEESLNDDEEAQKGTDATQTGMEVKSEDKTEDVSPPAPSRHTSSKKGGSRKGKAK